MPLKFHKRASHASVVVRPAGHKSFVTAEGPVPQAANERKDYVTKTESKTVSETKISNDPKQMDGKTESSAIFTPPPEVAKNLPKYCFYALALLNMHHAGQGGTRFHLLNLRVISFGFASG